MKTKTISFESQVLLGFALFVVALGVIVIIILHSSNQETIAKLNEIKQEP